MEKILKKLGEPFGVLAESSTYQLKVIALNADVALGDLFIMPSQRGNIDRFYLFRTTEYANVLNRSFELSEIARSKLTMPDSYFSEDLANEKLIELKGILLGYAEFFQGGWIFKKPRRLPEHFTNVYQVRNNDPDVAEVVKLLLQGQLGSNGLLVGKIMAGEGFLPQVDVFLPTVSLSHHIGIFGRTGAGKSNLMMVLLSSIMKHNEAVEAGMEQDRKASIFAIDPHDEFKAWHSASGGSEGIRGIVNGYSDNQQQNLISPFYYLTSKRLEKEGLERTIKFSRADLLPDDLYSIMEFTEQQIAYLNRQFNLWGEEWVLRTLLGDTFDLENSEQGADFLPGTKSAVQRRMSFLSGSNSKIITTFDEEAGNFYDSILIDLVCALEKGRVIIVDTSLLNELEQFLLTTVLARTLFTLRKSLRSVEHVENLEEAIKTAFRVNETLGQTGLRTLAEGFVYSLREGSLPYIRNEKVVSPDDLPYINVVIEEAPSILNPQRLRFGSVFRDISRQGRKFGIGLTVISQQVSEIDKGVLTQINTEFNMSLGNDEERREAVRNASGDLKGFEQELQVMGKGQVILTTVFKEIPIPIQVLPYDNIAFKE
ncbi:ATP-binding protein [Spirosoma spitsbergense]|uniref:ATP-binding protein n=1 Tax=Spirosoma spitsbergense TaxID=431554 RepID=UPI000382BF76|nr:ATP-binding protein [Spirosoma spitsbergense]